jgi:hypothetical protein
MRTKLIIRIDGIGFKNISSLCVGDLNIIIMVDSRQTLFTIVQNLETSPLTCAPPHITLFQAILIDYSDIILLPKPLYSFVFGTGKATSLNQKTPLSLIPHLQPSNNSRHLLVGIDSESLLLCDRGELDIARVELLFHHLFEGSEDEVFGFFECEGLVGC